MSNYPYIIASLPLLLQDGSEMLAVPPILDEIREQLGSRDQALFSLTLDGFDAGKLDATFYRQALRCPNAFIRAYFRCDLGVRNTKTAFLNRRLSRPEQTDVLILEGDESPIEEPGILPILAGTDLLVRERELDAYLWDKAESLIELHILDLDIILSYTVRLKLAERWMRLDPQSGRERLRSLVEEIKNTQNPNNAIWQPKES